MGRAPCCDKANVKKGPWSPEEDAKLKAYIEQHGTGGNWIALPKKIGLKRCGKSCRLRWLNYLRPNIKHGGFSEEEDNIICSLYLSIGSRWSIIAAQLPGRTDNDIKNYWNTRLKKKLLGKQRKEHQARKASCLKQEIKNKSMGISNLMVTEPQNSCYPGNPMPSPYPNQTLDPPLNDQASIRKLLIKLGGRFSINDQRQQQPNNLHQNPLGFSLNDDHQQFYNSSMSNSFSQLLNNQYDLDMASVHMLQGINSLPVHQFDDHEMMAYNMNPERLEGGLECSYGMDMANGCTGPISDDSTSWDGMGPLAYTQTVSDFDSVQPAGMLQAYAFEELHQSRYIGLN